jgi:hypothetical protein
MGGTKNVCFNCRKAFNIHLDDTRQGNCPECGQPLTLMTHRFRPPKKDDEKKWETVKYLVDNGFSFQHIYAEVETKDKMKPKIVNVSYPENLRDAREFVTKYASQARKKSK